MDWEVENAEVEVGMVVTEELVIIIVELEIIYGQVVEVVGMEVMEEMLIFLEIIAIYDFQQLVVVVEVVGMEVMEVI